MAKFYSIFRIIFNDVAEPWQLGFQDTAAPGFTGLVTLHNTIGFYLIVISFSVFWVLFSLIYYYSSNKNQIAHKYLTHGTVLELVWTITPALILIAIAFPSFRLLYLMDEVISPTLTIKVVGLILKKDGLKSNILNKIKDTKFVVSFSLFIFIFKLKVKRKSCPRTTPTTTTTITTITTTTPAGPSSLRGSKKLDTISSKNNQSILKSKSINNYTSLVG
jgi:hypothetical protein